MCIAISAADAEKASDLEASTIAAGAEEDDAAGAAEAAIKEASVIAASVVSGAAAGEDAVKEILKKLADEDSTEYGIILRAKGIVQNEEGKWLHFDLVPGEEEVRYGAADYTGRICVIGSDLKEDKLAELFGL